MGVGGEGLSCPEQWGRRAAGPTPEQAGGVTMIHPHTHTHTQAGPQNLHREPAGYIQINWFFPLPPQTTEPQTKHPSGKTRKQN